MNDMRFPLYLPGLNKKENEGLCVLAADIGGTKTNMGWFMAHQGHMELQQEKTYVSRDHDTFLDIVLLFIKDHGLKLPDVLSIGVAGPVVDGKSITTNLPWSLDKEVLKSQLRVARVELINDLEATAYGLAEVNEGYLATIHPGNKNSTGNVAILAPGTGLGEAGLFWDGQALRPFATEGGHSSFAPRSKTDVEFYEYLQGRFGTVSWEHVVSGPGIYNIYQFLRDVKKHPEPAWLKQRFEEESDPTAVVSHTAMRELDPTCTLAMQMFVEYMAQEANSLVLKLKATGALLLGGGIPPKIFNLINKDKFHANFIISDKVSHILREIPIYLILNSKTALLGSAYYGAFGK